MWTFQERRKFRSGSDHPGTLSVVEKLRARFPALTLWPLCLLCYRNHDERRPNHRSSTAGTKTSCFSPSPFPQKVQCVLFLQNPLRSGLLLQEDRITYTQVEQCADIVGKQIRQAILQSVKKMVVNTKQTIEGKELHQLMIKSIRGYLPDTAAGGKTKRKISLGAVLNKFVKLVDEPEVREESEPLKVIEETICKHYAEGVEGVPDTSMLKLKVQKLHDAYSKVLKRRTTEKDRIKEWLHVIREGNDSFRKVYDNIWQQV